MAIKQCAGALFVPLMLLVGGCALGRPTGTASVPASAPAASDSQPASAAAALFDEDGVRISKQIDYVVAQILPQVRSVSGYTMQSEDTPTVRLAINVWVGWAPVIYANGGLKPGKVWTTPDGKRFNLELVLIDDPVLMLAAYAAGDVHLGWASLDMLPLFLRSLPQDARTAPRVFQLIDWSNGGDGIVVRDPITKIGDLRGKTVVLAQNSPSEYFALNALINGGVAPSEVNFKYAPDAFQAAAAFVADKSISACVAWSPDIYEIAKTPGTRLLVSTRDANRLIANVWFARADFARDNPQVIEALVRGILDAVEELKTPERQQVAAQLMADGFKVPPADAASMLGDAHWTNYAENAAFFLDADSPASFQRTWDTAYLLYGRVGKVGERVPWDQVADASVIRKLGGEQKYAASVSGYQVQFPPRRVDEIEAGSEILTKTVVVRFAPNNSDMRYKVDGNTPYDPNVDAVLEEIGRLAGAYGASRIVIEGHCDSSMKGQLPDDEMVRQLSQQRAESVRAELLKKFPSLPPDQVSAKGFGWDRPADPGDPMNHARNRRIEAKVFRLE